jgi:hypothetical protein
MAQDFETVCELKGSFLREHTVDSCGILPPVKGTRPVRERNGLRILENQG